MIDNSDGNSNNGGLRSKFRERLRLIKISRFKKFKRINDKELENKKFIEDKIKEIREVVWCDVKDNPYRSDVVVKFRGKGLSNRGKVVKDKVNRSVVVNEKFLAENKDNDVKEVVVSIDKDTIRGKNTGFKDSYEEYIEKVYNEIKRTFLDRDYGNRYGIVSKIKNNYKGCDFKKALNSVKDDDLKEVIISELGIKIIKRFRSDFDKKLSELEVLESELYFIEKNNDVALDLERVNKVKKEIRNIIGKINNIIRDYNIYSDNYGLENFVDINDGVVVDDIINFKEVVQNYNINRDLVNDYKLLEEFQELYYKLDNISNSVNRIVGKNQEKIDKYDVRDKKYNEIKLKMAKSDKVLSECNLEIDRQNEYLKKLMGDISKIDNKEYFSYQFKGIDNLVGSTLKYLGLLMVRPLSGLIPSIAVNTIATRKMIDNIYKNMRIEKVKKIEYSAVDYERDINNKINDIDYTYLLIDDTVKVIDNLRDDFMRQYSPKIKGYSDTLRKIDEISNKVNSNRYKMDIIKKNLVESKKINAEKLGRVRVLNKSG